LTTVNTGGFFGPPALIPFNRKNPRVMKEIDSKKAIFLDMIFPSFFKKGSSAESGRSLRLIQFRNRGLWAKSESIGSAVKKKVPKEKVCPLGTVWSSRKKSETMP
jgi:hypothetical protein